MHLLITGATGLIGRRLVIDRLTHGDKVTVVSRDAAAAASLFAAGANPNVRIVEGDVGVPGEWQRAINGVDAVVHLAGAGIVDRRWTAAYKETIVRSRLDGTHQVVNAIEDARHRPAVLVSASAVGYYGNSGDREVDESAPPGAGFGAELCVGWEKQSLAAVELGVRTCVLRIGIVLDERGGALGRMIPLFRWGLGGTVGSGRQYTPWIHWRDVVGIVDLALREPGCRGPLNTTAPNPVTGREFAEALGAVLRRPSLLHMPVAALRIVMGEVAELLAEGQRALPSAALRRGYRFVHPEVGRALHALLGVERNASAPVPTRPATGSSRPAGRAALPKVATPASAPVRPAAASPPSRPATGIKLLAVDVDGTLLRSDGRLTSRVVEAIARAQVAGCTVVLATARSPKGMVDIVTRAELASPTINFNGALIWNPVDERSLFHEALPADVARAVVDAARRLHPRVVVEVDVLDRCFADRIDPRFPPGSLRLAHPDSIGPLDRVLSSPVSKVNLVGEPDALGRIADMVRARFWRLGQVTLFHTHPSLIQVLAPRVDKGIALQRIARRLGAAREQVAAIGDASNDLGMIEWAGLGLAVANAAPEVRALANAIVPSNDENGVAIAVERHVLGTAARAPAPAPGRPSFPVL